MLIYVDIDDTITKTDGVNYANAQPLQDRINRINQLYSQGHTIVYWTARGTKTGLDHRQLTLQQLRSWGCSFHQLVMGKPAFDLFIDDKAIQSEHFFSDRSQSSIVSISSISD